MSSRPRLGASDCNNIEDHFAAFISAFATQGFIKSYTSISETIRNHHNNHEFRLAFFALSESQPAAGRSSANLVGVFLLLPAERLKNS